MMNQHSIVIIAVATIASAMVFQQQQSFAQTNEPKASIANSKYLTIKDVRFRDEGFCSILDISGWIWPWLSSSDSAFSYKYWLDFFGLALFAA